MANLKDGKHPYWAFPLMVFSAFSVLLNNFLLYLFLFILIRWGRAEVYEYWEHIKELRCKAGITQKALSVETNIPLQSVVNYENGRREPNARAMAALERYFGVTGSYLCGEESLEENKPKNALVLTDAVLSTSKESSQEISQALSHITKAGLDAAQILKAFAVLSADGQKEMLKRVEEYAAVENQKGQPKKAQKNSHPQDDSGATIHIAARDGTRVTKTISTELRDQIRNLPSEDFDI